MRIGARTAYIINRTTTRVVILARFVVLTYRESGEPNRIYLYSRYTCRGRTNTVTVYGGRVATLSKGMVESIDESIDSLENAVQLQRLQR